MSLPCLSDLFNRNGIMLSIRIRKLFAAIFITLIVLSCVACSGLDMSLLQRDFQVYEATGVEEALKTFGVVQIHAICSDFNMKDGTGIELLERLYHALNFYITLCMAFLAHMSMKSETHALKAAIIQKADPIKEKVQFSYYRLAKGISGILSYAKEGIRLWFRTKRPSYRQLCLKLTA